MARSGRRFGPLFYLTLFGALLVVLSVPFLPTAIVQGRAWRLSRQLLDADPATRQEAAQSLVQLGPTATSWIIRAMDDDNPQVRLVACSALVRTDPDHPERTKDALLAACADGDALVREAAIGQLELLFHLRSEIPRSDVKERVLRALRAALADGSPQVRMAAAQTLISLGSAATSAVVDLERALDGPDLGLRVVAATSLLRIDPVHTRSRVIAAMRALRLDDSIPWQNQGPRVIQILTEQEGEDAVAAMLIPLLKHQEMTRRHQAITELIAHCPGSKALMATLDDCLKSDDGGVRCEAALYLLQHQPALASRALDTLVEQILEPLDGSYFPWDLIRRLKGDSFTRMMHSQVGSPESLAPVTRAMIDTLKRTDKPGRRDNALLTLGEIGPEAISAVPALLEVAGSRDRKCALAAVQALVKIDSKSAQTEIPALVNWMVSREESAIRLGAMAALRDIGPPAAAAVPALLEAADEEDLSISAAAIEALARIEPATAAALKRAIETGALRSRDD
jgi:HEAT repeat protein